MRSLLVTLFLTLPLLLFPKGPKAQMDSFRYETYRDGSAAVYYLHKTDRGTSLYYRDLGSSEGWFLSSVDDGALEAIAKIYKKNKLSAYSGNDLDSEDKTRDRWIAEATFGPEKKHTIIEYTPSPRSETDVKIEDEIIGFIHRLLEEQEASGRRCSSSKCTYGPDGTLLRRVDYTPDGKVHGGYDARDPYATF